MSTVLFVLEMGKVFLGIENLQQQQLSLDSINNYSWLRILYDFSLLTTLGTVNWDVLIMK